MLGNLISLPFLEREAESLMAIVLVVSLIFVVLHSDEVAVNGLRIQGQRHEGVDGGGFGNDFECPGLWFVSGRL